MRKFSILLLALALLVSVTACSRRDEQHPESGTVSEISESGDGDAPAYEGTGEILEVFPENPEDIVTFHIQNQAGEDVAGVEVEMGSYYLGSSDWRGIVVWDRGYTNMLPLPAPGAYALTLTSWVDDLRQIATVEVPEVPGTVALTWTMPNPGSTLPQPQSSVTLQFRDGNGPLGGITVTTSAGPETDGDRIDLALVLGQSDARGEILWREPAPGTYVLHAFNEQEESRTYTIEIPEGDGNTDITLDW